MKLSQLIKYLNNLEAMPVDRIHQSTDRELRLITHLVSHAPPIEGFETDLLDCYEDINESFEKFDQSVVKIKQEIKKQVTEIEKKYFQDSYTLFEKDMALEPIEYILNRRQSVTGENTKFASFEAETILKGRLHQSSDWRFPGMVIRPGLENFVDSMVDYDPLYIIDHDHGLLQPCLDRFPTLYKNRLRPYVVNERCDDPILGKIPDNQFGMCLVYNFFNFRPLEIIRKYLTEIYSKLRPGGKLIMTFNDCDNFMAVELCENHYACYTPGYLIYDLVKSIGYEQSYKWSDGGASVWLELQKPGELTSLRGGQTIAVVNDINQIDIDLEKIYTSDELFRLQQQAISLGADETSVVKLSAEELVQTVRHLRRQKNALDEQARLANEMVQNAEEIDRQQKEKLRQLREKALALGIGDPNLVRYGYSAAKLEALIKEKEEGQK